MSDHNRSDVAAREIAHAASMFIARESNRTSLITVTRADISPDGSRSTIYVSVLPESAEEDALDFLKRSRSDFKAWVMKEVRLRRIPFFDFALDYGEKNRQIVQPL